MCCNNMWCYIDMSHCEWAVCGYEGFFGVVFIVVCRYSSVYNQITVHTRGCRKVVKSGWQVVRLLFFYVFSPKFQNLSYFQG